MEGYSLNYFFMSGLGYLFYGAYMTIGYFTKIKGAGICYFI